MDMKYREEKLVKLFHSKDIINIADLIVKIKEKKHPKFKRANTKDLIYTHKINLIEALNSVPVSVITLDNRKLTITMDEIISPQTVKLVKGEGMPVFDREKPLENLLFKERKGDMYIKFDIKFPSFIDPIKKEEITRLLEENDE